jgi:hypothetical protein
LEFSFLAYLKFADLRLGSQDKQLAKISYIMACLAPAPAAVGVLAKADKYISALLPLASSMDSSKFKTYKQ